MTSSSPEPPVRPWRPGLPAPDGALRKARRVVAISRLVLIALAIWCGYQADRTEAIDLAESDRWTVMMLVSIVLIWVGGLVWWTEPDTPEPLRKNVRARTIGRWIRALLAAGGLTVGSAAVIAGEDELGSVAIIVFVLSPLAYAIASLSGQAEASQWLHETSTPVRQSDPRQPDSPALEAISSVREALVEPDKARRGGSLTIRPRNRAESRAPVGMTGWLRNGALSTDGKTISVTDRAGRVLQRPLGGKSGVATLLAARETVSTWTRLGWSTPQRRERLCLLDRSGHRLLDVELYGWSRSDLVSFARTAGVGLEKYEPAEIQYVWPTLQGTTITPLAEAAPPTHGFRTVRGRSPWLEVLLVAALSVVVIGLLMGAGFLAVQVDTALGLPPPWGAGVVYGVASIVLIGALVYASRKLAAWHQRRQQPDPSTYDYDTI